MSLSVGKREKQLDSTLDNDTQFGTDEDINIPQLTTNDTHTHSSSWSDISTTSVLPSGEKDAISSPFLIQDWPFPEQGGGDPFANLTIPIQNHEFKTKDGQSLHHHFHHHHKGSLLENKITIASPPNNRNLTTCKEKTNPVNSDCDPIHDECYDIQIKLEKQIANNEAIIARYQQALNYFYNGHALQGEQENQLIKSQSNELENKNKMLKEENIQLQEKNNQLLSQTEYLQHSLMEHMKREHARLDAFNNEISDLKKRIDSKNIEVIKIKEVKQFRSDINKVFNALSIGIKEAQEKVNLQEEKLDNLAYSISKTITEEEEEQILTESELKTLTESLLLIHREEIENLKASYNKEKEILERTYERAFEEKDIEINQHANIMKNQSARHKKQELTLQQEMEERRQLQTKVVELENLVNSLLESQRIMKYKLERRTSQLQRLHAGAEVEAAARRIELAARMRQDKSRELSALVADLENRYKSILAESTERARHQQNNDQKRIMHLESIIWRSGLQNHTNSRIWENFKPNLSSSEPDHEQSLLPLTNEHINNETIPCEINNELNSTNINN